MALTVPSITAIQCNNPLSGPTVDQRAWVQFLCTVLHKIDAGQTCDFTALLASATADGLVCQGNQRTRDRIRSMIWSSLSLPDTTLACYNPDQLTGIEAELVHAILSAI